MSTHSLLLVGLGATVQDAGQSLIALAHRLDKAPTKLILAGAVGLGAASYRTARHFNDKLAWEMRGRRPTSRRLPFLR